MKKEHTYQDSVNDAEWENPANWWGGLLYHSLRDDRVVVPKRAPLAGVTFNLAKPLGLAIILAIPVVLIALVIRAILRH
jgi:uncharacterized membrane protein